METNRLSSLFPPTHRPANRSLAWTTRLVGALAFALLAACASVEPEPPRAAPDGATPTSERATTDANPQASDDLTRGPGSDAPLEARVAGDLDASLPLSPDVVHGTLDNGLRYFIRKNAEPADRAELRLVVAAGSAFEDDDQRGMAHFVEHMAFNGTERFEKHELIDYLQSIGMRFGADLNAYTSFDETMYLLKLPTEDPEILERGITILAEWAGGVAFDSEEIAAERGVVLEEWRRSQGADARMIDRMIPLVFRGARYAERLPIGTEDSIQNTTEDAIRRFYRDWYRPDLMAVIAVGDFEPAQVEAALREQLSRLEAPAEPRPRPDLDVPPHDETLVGIFADPEVTTTQLTVLVKHPPAPEGTYRDYRRSLVEMLYSLMVNARLQEIAQRPDPPFVFANSSLGGLTRGTLQFQLAAQVREGQVERGLEAMLVEMERIDRFGFATGELERAKAGVSRLYAQLLAESRQQPSTALADELARHVLEGEPVPGIEVEAGLAERFVPGIGLDEVNALGRGYITEANRVVLLTAPDKADLDLPSEDELLAVFEANASDAPALASLEPWVDRVVEQPLLAEAPVAGSIDEERSYASVGITEWTLSNGARVLIKPTDFRNDQVVFSAWSPGGSSVYDDTTWRSARFADTIASQSGLGAFDLVSLDKALAGKLAAVSPQVGYIEEGLSGGGSPADLETLLQLAHLRFVAPRFDPEVWESLEQRIGSLIENRLQNPESVFGDAMNLALSSDHPRRQPLDLDALAAVDPEVAHKAYQDRFADASDFTFLFVGAVDPETLRPLVETYLASLPATDRREQGLDLGIAPPPGITQVRIERGLEPRSRVRMVFHGTGPWSREASFRLKALSDVLDLRITEVLREELGAIYGARVSAIFDPKPAPRWDLTVDFVCDPQRTDELIGEVLAMVEDLRTEGPDPGAVAKVQEALRRKRQTDLRENGFWSAVIQTYDSLGLDPGLILENDALVDGLSVDTLRETAIERLDPEQYVVGVLDPAPGVVTEGEATGAADTAP